MTDIFGSPAPLPCLSLWQPWASLIVAGLKTHETRHWPTRVRGPVALHAAKRCDVEGAPDRLCEYAFGPEWSKSLPAGCVLAVAQLTACLQTNVVRERVTHSDLLAGNFGPERYAFRLEAVRPLRQPLPLKGAQGFFRWTPPADLEAQLLVPVDHPATAQRWLAHYRGAER